MTHEYNGIADDTCPMGCIFYRGKLHGDCRAPARKDCALNVRHRGTDLDVSTPEQEPEHG